MRNDSVAHYREIRFNMIKLRAMSLLFENIKMEKAYSDKILLYGNSIKSFGRWSV